MEPNFDLPFRQTELVRHLYPPPPGEVVVGVELLLQLQGLIPFGYIDYSRMVHVWLTCASIADLVLKYFIEDKRICKSFAQMHVANFRLKINIIKEFKFEIVLHRQNKKQRPSADTDLV